MKRSVSIILSAALALLAPSGCDNKQAAAETSGDTSQSAAGGSTGSTVISAEASETAKEIADSIFASDSSSFATWKDVDKDALIAYIDTEEYGDWFNVRFDELYKEYVYYLMINNITDDMAEENAETCRSYRSNIIDYLTYERMFLYEAEHTYGISEATLTEEQKKEIEENVEEVKNSAASSFYDTVSAKMGTAVTIDDINAMCREVLNVLLTKCGLDDSIFKRWETNSYIQQLLLKELTKDINIDESQVDDMFETFVEEAKNLAENNVAEYENSAVYMMVYVPEETRSAKHILLSFDEDSLTAIAEAVNSGDTEKEKKLIEEAYTDDLKIKADEIKDRLRAGEDFTKLQSEYGTVGEDEYIVLKNSESFFDEYKNALYALENKGDVSEPVVCSNGIYFIQYSDDATVSEESVKSIRQNMKEYLEELEQNVKQSNAYTEWTEKYSYTIDKELLKIEEEDVGAVDVVSDETIE